MVDKKLTVTLGELKKMVIEVRGRWVEEVTRRYGMQKRKERFKINLKDFFKQIEKIKNDKEFVYDLTVEDNHSFIAEGFIVHNTTTISKFASYYSKRGHKICAISLDVHRPAAAEQLAQLCKKLNIQSFTNPNEKSPEKLWKSFLPELKKYEIMAQIESRIALS